jgi:hypothetical protein
MVSPPAVAGNETSVPLCIVMVRNEPSAMVEPIQTLPCLSVGKLRQGDRQWVVALALF